MTARLWILKILDGLFTLLGEILVFFGVYAFLLSQSVSLAFAGIFLMLLGQMAGINAIRYEEKKKLLFFQFEMLENMGRQFAYPVMIFVLYLMNKSEVLLVLAFSFTLIAVVKSLATFYKAKLIGEIRT